MKARSFIVRALLFAVVLVPAAMRMGAKPLGAPLCRVANPQLQAIDAGVQTGWALDQFLASKRSHRAPATRLHRIHGKKINLQIATSCDDYYFYVWIDNKRTSRSGYR